MASEDIESGKYKKTAIDEDVYEKKAEEPGKQPS